MKTHTPLSFPRLVLPAALGAMIAFAALPLPAIAAPESLAPQSAEAAFKQWQEHCRLNRGTNCDSMEAFLAETVKLPKVPPHKPAAIQPAKPSPTPASPPPNPAPSKEPARK